jgi:hypothetical protein
MFEKYPSTLRAVIGVFVEHAGKPRKIPHSLYFFDQVRVTVQ